jgi:hypothetical protein
VLTLRRNRRGYRVQGSKGIILAAIALAALVIPATSASAQSGIFDSLFGRRPSAPSSASAFADPFSQWNPFGARTPETPRTDAVGTAAYCVRLCDGRYFPIERHGDASPAQACSSFCPASPTKIYSGGSIDQAVGPDGKPYRELSTAFTYREKIVPGCTCNGRDAFGLVNTPIEDDPTLRPGDIVATKSGLAAYNGGAKRHAASFTPIASYSGLSGELRRKLTETKIAPAAETPAPPVQAKQEDAASRNAKSKRVQAAR